MQFFDSPIWGKIAMPQSFIELLSVAFANDVGGRNVYLWRGQADIRWSLDSSGARKTINHYKTNKIEIPDAQHLEEHVSYWEGLLLSKAKKELYNYDERGRQINDIELLARLQHFGAATRLLDFSKNILVALWFCVSAKSHKDETGLLIGVHTDVVGGMEGHFNFNQDYPSFCAFLEHHSKSSSYIYAVDAPAVTSRINAQHSVFLCSICKESPHGYFQLPDDEKYVKCMAISPELKQEALAMLSAHFDITPYTLFPDIEGFALANSTDVTFSELDRW